MLLISGNSFRIGSISRTMVLIAMAGSLVACNTSSVFPTKEIYTQGYVLDQDALDATPVGSSREQVLLSLGTPSTTQNFGDSETFYYISQKRQRNIAFQRIRVVDQTVLAVYFDDTGTVINISNYAMQDGKVFDMISRTTPTSGKERGFLLGILAGFSDGSTDVAR